jgi:hypothetical protein
MRLNNSQSFLPCNSTNQDPSPIRWTNEVIVAVLLDQSGSLPCCGIVPIRILLAVFRANQDPSCHVMETSSSRAIRLIRIRILHRCSPEIGGLRAKVHNHCRYEGSLSPPFLLTLCKAISRIEVLRF